MRNSDMILGRCVAGTKKCRLSLKIYVVWILTEWPWRRVWCDLIADVYSVVIVIANVNEAFSFSVRYRTATGNTRTNVLKQYITAMKRSCINSYGSRRNVAINDSWVCEINEPKRSARGMDRHISGCGNHLYDGTLDLNNWRCRNCVPLRPMAL